MKKFCVPVITAFLFVNVLCQDSWAEKFQQNMHNFGRQLSQNLQQQGRDIEQQAKRYAEQAKEEEMKRKAELQSQQDELMETVKQIQEGHLPSGVNSANTSTLIENVNGRLLTIKNTAYSIGNENNGIIHNVQIISEEDKVIDWSVNSLIWDGNQLKKRLIQNAPQSGVNQFGNSQSVVITSGGVINAGGTSIISTNQGGIITQEISL
ncbi:uncharacterized protein LOC117178050 isoform X2 [Belonocnema kinseyi]|uniref:uncharacterized protein LOC117178050 isoform X2 n=1 Tax=Belonocnema kinseyi TaxID=2817044 RepID=UPI00143D2B2B|nr:uncharacterized protein LOC117178050 isoform X2 [Belonocnema kinseyi]